MTELEIKVLRAAEAKEGAWYGFTTPSHRTAQDLELKGLLRQMPRGASPFHDGYKTTRPGKQALKETKTG